MVQSRYAFGQRILTCSAHHSRQCDLSTSPENGRTFKMRSGAYAHSRKLHGSSSGLTDWTGTADVDSVGDAKVQTLCRPQGACEPISPETFSRSFGSLYSLTSWYDRRVYLIVGILDHCHSEPISMSSVPSTMSSGSEMPTMKRPVWPIGNGFETVESWSVRALKTRVHFEYLRL